MGKIVVQFFMLCFLQLVILQQVSCHYCEWDMCLSDQYCCGNNLCCQYVYSLWYFWVGIVFVILLVSACAGLFRYHWRPRQRDEGRGLLPPAFTGLHRGQPPVLTGGPVAPYGKVPTPAAASGFSSQPQQSSSHGQSHYHYQIMTDT